MDDRFINRELSWIAFDERVLDLATEAGIPLLERAKFCAIATTNLDEFFQVRVAALKDQVAAKIEEPTPDGRTATQQLADIAARASGRWSPVRTPCSSTSSARRWPRRASSIVHWSELGPSRPQGDDRGLRAAGVPRADAARRRPQPPLPVHLRPRPVGGGVRPRSGDDGAPVRPGQGARPPAAARADRRRALPAGRGARHRPSRVACSPA